jgi:hypothetical protein
MRWHQNPIFDREKHVLKEAQVRRIRKFLLEVNQGWHTYQWFMDLLRMGDDSQVIRYVLDHVEWGSATGRGKARKGILSAIDEYLEEQETERYPFIEIDESQIGVLREQQAAFPPHIQVRIDSLASKWHNLKLAKRLNEPREEIHRLQTQISSLLNEVNLSIAELQEQQAAEAAEVAAEIAEETKPLILRDCDFCKDETFDWLDPEARVDVVHLSSNEKIADIQHDLKHAIIELREATARRRPAIYIINLEDRIEYLHAQMERLRAKRFFRRNPVFEWHGGKHPIGWWHSNEKPVSDCEECHKAGWIRKLPYASAETLMEKVERYLRQKDIYSIGHTEKLSEDEIKLHIERDFVEGLRTSSRLVDEESEETPFKEYFPPSQRHQGRKSIRRPIRKHKHKHPPIKLPKDLDQIIRSHGWISHYQFLGRTLGRVVFILKPKQ